LTIAGYEAVPDLRRDRCDTAGGIGGGLLVYIKNGMKVLPLDLNIMFNQYTSFTLVSGSTSINFILVYRPPRNSIESYQQLAQLVRGAGANTVLLGDFNLPGIDWDSGTARGPGAELVLEACSDKFLEQLVTFPTHLKGNILDLILTNVPELFVDISSEGRLGTSDHYILKAEMEVGSPVSANQTLVRNWWKADWAAMKAELSAEDWNAVDQQTATEAWDTFKQRLDALVEKHVPLKPRGRPGRPPWMTRDILRTVRRKRRMWKKESGRNVSAEYKNVEKQVRNMIRHAKRNLERKLATENNGNSKPFYAYLKSKTKSRMPVGPLKDNNGNAVTDKKKMAEMLNSYFSSVFSQEEAAAVPAAEEEEVRSRLLDVQVDIAQVVKKIKALKPASAPGPDGLGSLLLRELVDQVAIPLTKIFRKSLDSGDVPADWRRANVTPIFKKGSKTDPANYRPVSLTSISCKLLESIVRDHLVDHMMENDLIEESQHGFVKGRSCATNLIEFFDHISEILDSGGVADSIFLDFAKAFDKVPKKRLLEKMRSIGIGGKVLAWVSNWLTDRKQRVVIDGEGSNWEAVTSGVPQGSVLGPVLFLIFIRDLDRATTGQVRIRKFADDTKVARKITGDADRAELQQVLDRMMDWAATWGMEFNSKKCKVMHFGSGNPQYQYQMAGHVLERTAEEKDVGVTIAQNLKPGAQCCRAARTASVVLGQISRSFTYRDQKIFPRLYTRYVRPHLEFASVAWNPWLQKDVEVLEKVQKRAVNMVSGLGDQSYEEKCKVLGLDTLKERRAEADLVMMYKVMNGFSTVKKENWVSPQARNRNITRAVADELCIKKPFARTDKRMNFYTVRVCDAWNGLPRNIRAARTVDQFKNKYRSHKRSERQGQGEN
jgi:Reverse transcriptase (RNA-dependent DNA polymerase)/Endonuclease-reverse transcriptase